MSANYEKTDKMMVEHASLTIANPVKRTVIYLFIFVVSALLFAWLFTINIEWGFSAFGKKILYLTAVLLIGIGHNLFFPKWFPQMHGQDKNTRLFYSITLTILVGVSTFLFFGFTKIEKPLFSVTVGLGFLLPAAILQSWNYFDLISPTTYNKAWYIPPAAPPQKKATIFLNSLQVRVKIKLHYFDIAEKSFMVIVPARLQLGNMFHQFLAEREADTKIQQSDQYLQPYAWRFLLQKPLGNKILDPELTLIDNRIKQKDTILAERIKTT